MSKMTFVVEFEDGKEPTVHAAMTFKGGKVLRAAWSDVIQEYDDLQEELLDAEMGDDFQ
jgi:hypothetical protein